METLKDDIKLVVIGKPWLKNREDYILKKFIDFFGLSKVIRKERKGKLLSLKLLESENSLIATLVEEIKPVVAVKDDFACRNISKIL